MVKNIAATKVLKEKLANARANSDAAMSEPRATRAFYDAYLGMIIVFLSNKCMFGFPSELGEGLVSASVKDLAEVEVTPSGEALHWKTLDVDLSIPALMNGIFGTKKWMAELARKGGSSTSSAKSEASRLNGIKGGRPGKEIVLAIDEGNYLQGNYYAAAQQQNLTEAAAEIQKLLEQLEQSYSTATTAGKMAIATEAISQIESNPTLSARILSALQAGGVSAFEQFLNHPTASFVIGALEDWEKTMKNQ